MGAGVGTLQKFSVAVGAAVQRVRAVSVAADGVGGESRAADLTTVLNPNTRLGKVKEEFSVFDGRFGIGVLILQGKGREGRFRDSLVTALMAGS